MSIGILRLSTKSIKIILAENSLDCLTQTDLKPLGQDGVLLTELCVLQLRVS